jgi:ATPase family protein associated with various cellular activities (AAA)
VTGIWGLGLGLTDLPEPADVFRLARRVLRKVVQAARAEDEAPQRLLSGHLGPQAVAAAVVSGSWRAYDHVNLQAGLDAWLAAGGRRHTLVGLTGFQHANAGLADLMHPDGDGYGIGVGSVAMTSLPAGPAGQARACVQYGLYLVTDGDARLALLLRGPDASRDDAEATLEVACADQAAAQRVVDEVRTMAITHNVFRGQVIAFGGEIFGHGKESRLRFLDRPRLDRASVVLPPAVIDGIERQVLGVNRHAGQLLASGQHLKRGVLLHGAPGTGKTHTIRYLLGRLPGVTVVVLSGHALQWIAEACSVARMLQPAVVVVEDVDLIAEERGPRSGQHPLLFQLLNEMDGLGEDADVTFLLTTNRPELLETALAARPGRVDHAAELPFPDADARRRLIELYQGNLALELSDPEEMVTRTDGVTAAFLKELLRRAALLAAESAAPGNGAAQTNGGAAAGHAAATAPLAGTNGCGPAAPLRVTDAHMEAALNQLLDVRAWLTRSFLGERGRSGQDAVIRPMGADLVIRRPRGYRPA